MTSCVGSHLFLYLTAESAEDTELTKMAQRRNIINTKNCCLLRLIERLKFKL